MCKRQNVNLQNLSLPERDRSVEMLFVSASLNKGEIWGAIAFGQSREATRRFAFKTVTRTGRLTVCDGLWRCVYVDRSTA